MQTTETKKNETANVSTELELFSLTKPELPASGLKLNGTQSSDGNIIRLSLAVDGRKAVAKSLGVAANKENAGKIDREYLRLGDAVMKAGIAEVVGLSSSGAVTGARMTMTSNKKNGKRRYNLSLVSVDRSQGRKLTKDQLAEALAALSADEQIAVMEASEAIAKQAAPAIEAV